MALFDMSADFQTFYNTHVRLGTTRRQDLAGKRDLNLKRLNDGLDDLAAESRQSRPHPHSTRNQGSYAMHTLNQDPAGENDFDIDVGVLFNKDDLPGDPLKARQRVADALAKRCTNFTQEPTAKKNAVRVAYADGYHIDFAVYRTYKNSAGYEQIEHASTEWKPRDPDAINTWFDRCVTEKSPKPTPSMNYTPKVEAGQFRRVVRFLKWFARSRPSWSLPGGLIMSALAAEVYVKDDNRDDVAFHGTINRLAARLNGNTKVYNPASGNEFTANCEVHSQVKRLKKQVSMAVSKLKPLSEQDCTRAKARSAWDWVFNHPFWADADKVQKAALDEAITGAALMPYHVRVRCELASRHLGIPYRDYASGGGVLQKNVHLKFTLLDTNVPPPFLITWEVRNSGDEAADDNALTHATPAGHNYTHWTSTAYKGNHRMICKITKNGAVVAQTSHLVRIAPGKWWRFR